jgi:hypothetical protein
MATKKTTPPVAIDTSAAAAPVVVAAPAKAVRKPRAKAAPPAVKAATPAPQAKPVKKAKAVPAASTEPKAPKEKLVRDSFTMPRSDFALIDQLKERALAFKRPTKKSELLRAGLQALVGLSDAQLKSVLAGLTPLKAGRPKNKD